MPFVMIFESPTRCFPNSGRIPCRQLWDKVHLMEKEVGWKCWLALLDGPSRTHDDSPEPSIYEQGLSFASSSLPWPEGIPMSLLWLGEIIPSYGRIVSWIKCPCHVGHTLQQPFLESHIQSRKTCRSVPSLICLEYRVFGLYNHAALGQPFNN